MFFNVALFSGLLLVLAVLAVPSALGARVARRREGRQSQPNSRRQQIDSETQYSYNGAGAILTEDNVRSSGYSAIVIGLIRILFYITGEFHLGHRDVHRPHPIGFTRGFCRRLGWYQW
jgi:hypothetical protein